MVPAQQRLAAGYAAAGEVELGLQVHGQLLFRGGEAQFAGHPVLRDLNLAQGGVYSMTRPRPRVLAS